MSGIMLCTVELDGEDQNRTGREVYMQEKQTIYGLTAEAHIACTMFCFGLVIRRSWRILPIYVRFLFVSQAFRIISPQCGKSRVFSLPALSDIETMFMVAQGYRVGTEKPEAKRLLWPTCRQRNQRRRSSGRFGLTLIFIDVLGMQFAKQNRGRGEN